MGEESGEYCYLCREKVSEREEEDGKIFCCSGCRKVYSLLVKEGMLEELGKETSREPALGEEAVVSISGMECPSCAWFLERYLEREEGIEEARINYPLGKGRIIYSRDKIGKEKISQVLKSLGYYASSHIEESPYEKEGEVILQRLIVSLAFSMVVMWIYLLVLYPAYSRGLEGEVFRYHLVLIPPSSLVLFYSGHTFLRGAIAGAKMRRANMNTLIALGTSSAFAYSILATFTAREVYFDTVVMVVSLVLLGRFIENRARVSASSAISSLLELSGKEARVLKEGIEMSLPVREVARGNRVVVRAGERVPVDGVVLDGEGVVDDSMLTGEPLPREKGRGQEVAGGSVLTEGYLELEALRGGKHSTPAKMAELVERAQNAKAGFERLADRAGGYFSMVVIALALGVFLFWLGSTSPSHALVNAVTVLVVACPCALGLATPLAVLAGTSQGARRGIIIRGGEALERSRGLEVVLLDKTGTLTRGELSVKEVILSPHSPSPEEIIKLGAGVEHPSPHPLARAIVARARELNLDIPRVEDFEHLPGRGVRGMVRGREVVAGNAGFMREEGLEFDPALEGEEGIFLGREGRVRGVFKFKDSHREGALELVEWLKGRGMEVAMLTGDRDGPAREVGSRVGIEEVYSQVLPRDKVEVVKSYQARGRKVAMVGDGMNDAPALARADLGIATATGSEIASSSSDITVVGGELKKVREALKLSEKTYRVIKYNLGWAFAYNAVALPLAALGYLSPIYAALAMVASSTLVTAHSLKLKYL